MTAISNPPLYMQSTSYAALDFRAQTCAAWSGAGVVPSSAEALQVTETGPTSLAVQVSTGAAVILDTRGATGSNKFLAMSGAAAALVTLTTADATNPRIDRIVLRVRTTELGDASTSGSVEVVSGTPAGSPVAPATPTGAISLATVAVGAGVTAITNASITDTRTYADASYRPPIGATGSRPSNPVPGQLYSNSTLQILEMWNGTNWAPTAGAGASMYGSSDDTGYSVATGVTTDTAASVTFTTTSTNTQWLIEVTAQATLARNYAVRAEVRAKVDGTSTDTDGVFGLDYASYSTNVEAWQNMATIRGRCVVTLASAASHTILAQVFSSGDTTTFDTVTITVTPLAV
jgi:hypothetical protein